MGTQEQENTQGQLTRIEIPRPETTPDQLAERLLSLEYDESVAPLARALAGMCHILTDHVRFLYARQSRLLGLCGANAKAQKILDGHLAEVIEAVRPLVAATRGQSAPTPGQAAPQAQEPEEAGMSEEDEAAAMVEQAQAEAAAEMTKIEALALRKDAPAQVMLDGTAPSAPSRKAGPVIRKAPPTGTNGGAT